MAGAGVGGGSLVYANTLYRPDDAFYDDSQWRDIADWRRELAPYFELASQMLGVVQNRTVTASDEAMREVAEADGCRAHLRADPRRRLLRRRARCRQRGPVLRWRRSGAHRLPAVRRVHDRLPVRREEHAAQELPVAGRASGRAGAAPDDGDRPPTGRGGGWAVDTQRTGSWLARRTRRTLTAGQVVLAAGAYGTQRLLHRMRDDGHLPNISPRLGELTRTNSESLLGATTRRRGADFSRGVAITSSFRPDAGHPRRGGALRSRLQPARPDRHRPDRRRRAAAAVAALARRAAAPSGPGRAVPVGSALVAAHGHRAGDAVGRQLAGGLRRAVSPRPLAADHPAGSRRPQPDLDPGRQRGGPPAGSRDRRYRREAATWTSSTPR